MHTALMILLYLAIWSSSLAILFWIGHRWHYFK